MKEQPTQGTPTWIWWVSGGVLLTGGGIAAYLIHRQRQKRKEALTMMAGNAPARPPSNTPVTRTSYSSRAPGRTSSSSSSSTTTTSGGRVRPNWADPFDMRLEKAAIKYAGDRVKTLTDQQAESHAKKIWDAKADHIFDSHSPEDVQKVFGSLKSKVEVATLSRVFYETKERDLWQFLDSFLSESFMKRYVEDKVRALPNHL